MSKYTGVTVDHAEFEECVTEDGFYRCDFVTSWVPDSLNAALAKHHFKRHQIRRAWDSLLHHSSMNRRPPRALERYHVSVKRYAARDLDFDNLVSSFKDVIDAMVTVGILAGDEYKRTGPWTVAQEKVKGKEARIHVSITELPVLPDPKGSKKRSSFDSGLIIE